MNAEDSDRRIGQVIVRYGLPVLTAILSVVLCLNVSARNAERGREAQEQLKHTQCALITALDDNYHDAPLTTDLARRNAATMAQLRTSLGCEPRPS